MTDSQTPDARLPAFTQDDLEDLWRTAVVPVGQRRGFNEAVMRAVEEYTADKRVTSVETRNITRLQIKRLALKIYDWLEDMYDGLEDETPRHIARVQRALDNLNLAAVAYLTQFERPSEHDDPFWIVEGLTHDVLLRLYGNCCLGADIPKKGRKRPGGKRSRPVLNIKYGPPKTSIGPPKKFALDLLVARLAYAYEQATKNPATRFSSFSEFVVLLLNKIDEGTWDIDIEDPACLRRYRDSQKGD